MKDRYSDLSSVVNSGREELAGLCHTAPSNEPYQRPHQFHELLLESGADALLVTLEIRAATAPWRLSCRVASQGVAANERRTEAEQK